ncbi:hypothetical protein BHM03_00010889 [Ensete ventricosum]|nr:hypothetical protein BHM03_00010889 [Ensete ventricosum]
MSGTGFGSRGVLVHVQGKRQLPSEFEGTVGNGHLLRDTHWGCSTVGVLATSGPPSSAKNVVQLYAMAEMSAWLDSIQVHKDTHVGSEEVWCLVGSKRCLANGPEELEANLFSSPDPVLTLKPNGLHGVALSRTILGSPGMIRCFA